jgi:hypothetical protein
VTQSTSPARIVESLLARFPGTTVINAWGEASIFYNPGARLAHGVYFATIKQKDGENDRASKLDREDVFRLSIGTGKPLFFERFGPPPPRPAKGRVTEGSWDFTRLDSPTPHPIYGWMSWVSVLNPSEATLADLDEIIEAAYLKAKAAFEKRVG